MKTRSLLDTTSSKFSVVSSLVVMTASSRCAAQPYREREYHYTRGGITHDAQ